MRHTLLLIKASDSGESGQRRAVRMLCSKRADGDSRSAFMNPACSSAMAAVPLSSMPRPGLMWICTAPLSGWPTQHAATASMALVWLACVLNFCRITFIRNFQVFEHDLRI